MRIFVGQIAQTTTDEALAAAFAPFGNIHSAKVIVDPATGQSRGFGYVAFVNENDAARAIAQPPSVEGFPLRVMPWEGENQYEGSENPFQYWVTLYTDASFSKTGGSYGCRARNMHPPHRTEISGIVPVCADHNVAEMYAIVVGVEHVLETWGRVDGIGVRTDSQTAQNFLKYKARLHKRADFRALQLRLQAALEAKAKAQGSIVKLRIQWVRGHQSNETAQGWLNNRVDALTKKARS